MFAFNKNTSFQGENGFQMALWWEAGDDTAGLVSRCRRIVETMRTLLGDKELYILSSKLIAKEPEKGGSFAWHQVYLSEDIKEQFKLYTLLKDYGYFYENGVLFPDYCGSGKV